MLHWNGHHGLISILIWCEAQIAYMISINVIPHYDTIFEVFSIISLTLLIAVNFKKGWRDYAGMRKQIFLFIVKVFTKKSKRKPKS